MLTRYSNLLLVLIFAIALFLRFLYLPSNAISFAYDQARDAFLVQEILSGHPKILGPSVSGVPGLYHGVLYYYVITPAYFFGQGNPAFVAYFLSFISSLGVFVIYYFTLLVSKNKTPALVAALFFAFSFESTQYANLLTNASMGAWFVPIFYLGLYLWINKRYNLAPALTGLGLGLSIQSEVALAYHLFPLILWLFIYRKKISKREIINFILFLVIALATMIFSEIKFGFKSVGAVTYLLSGKDGISETKNLIDYISTLIDQSGKTLAYTIFPLNLIYGGLAGFLLIFSALKTNNRIWQILVSGIFAYALALPFGGWNMRHILVGAAPLICILMALVMWKYFAKIKPVFFLLVAIILTANTVVIFEENKKGQTIFPLQADLVLSKELSAIDYTYSEAGGKNFSISTLTSPLFVNTLWSYLYNWHGNKKYGYLPTWVGRDQVGQLGNNLEKATSRPHHFYIKEPTFGIPELWVTYAKGDQDAMSNFVSESKFGDLIVQKRRPF